MTTKGDESGQQQYAGTISVANVLLNMALGKTVSPEVYIARGMYDDDLENSTEDQRYFMATVLIHESCHVEHVRGGKDFLFFVRSSASGMRHEEIECHTVTDKEYLRSRLPPLWLTLTLVFLQYLK